MLLNLPGEAKSLIENKGFSVFRSDVPAGRCAIDMTIEQTTNKDAKTRGGIIVIEGISNRRLISVTGCLGFVEGLC